MSSCQSIFKCYQGFRWNMKSDITLCTGRHCDAGHDQQTSAGARCCNHWSFSRSTDMQSICHVSCAVILDNWTSKLHLVKQQPRKCSWMHGYSVFRYVLIHSVNPSYAGIVLQDEVRLRKGNFSLVCIRPPLNLSKRIYIVAIRCNRNDTIVVPAYNYYSNYTDVWV